MRNLATMLTLLISTPVVLAGAITYPQLENGNKVVLPICTDTSTDILTGCWSSTLCSTISNPWGEYSRYVLSFTADKAMHRNRLFYHNSSCSGKPVYSYIDNGGSDPYRLIIKEPNDSRPGHILLWENDHRAVWFTITSQGDSIRLCFSNNDYNNAGGLDFNAGAISNEIDIANCMVKGMP